MNRATHAVNHQPVGFRVFEVPATLNPEEALNRILKESPSLQVQLLAEAGLEGIRRQREADRREFEAEFFGAEPDADDVLVAMAERVHEMNHFEDGSLYCGCGPHAELESNFSAFSDQICGRCGREA